jgi:hypothetical protein
VAKVYSRKRLADTAGIENYKIWLSILATILGIIFLGMIYIAVDIESLILEITAYCTIFASIFIVVALSLYECFRDSSKKFVKFNKTVKVELDKYFGEVNQQMQSIGIEWSI